MSDIIKHKVSVCLATYNGEKYLKEQLSSILRQLSEEDEVIISDDCSEDHTLKIISNFNDKRLKVFKNPRKGIIYNFENALKKATGDFVFLADQDDIWLPGKVEKMVESLYRCDLVVSDCKIVDNEKNLIAESFFEELNSGAGFWKNFIKNTYLGCCMAFRKSVLNYTLPFPSGIAMHDIWIGLNADIRGKTHFINEPLLLYRRHGGNASFASEASKNTFYFKILYRLKMLYYILLRKLNN